VGNSFYHAGELVAQLSAINLMKTPSASPDGNQPDARQAFEALCSEIISVSGNITDVFGELVGVLGEDVVEEVVTEQIPDGPKLSTFTLPYFFDEDDTLPVPPRPARR
jgi:hypothetical protein